LNLRLFEDTRSLIDAKDKYYPIGRVPEYWDWLLHHGNAGDLKVPLEIFEEISPGLNKDDPFHAWRQDGVTAAALVLNEEVDPALVQKVLEDGYGQHLTDDELITIGKDPFLIALALGRSTPRQTVAQQEYGSIQ